MPAGHMARMAIQEASLQAALVAISRRTSGEARRVLDIEGAQKHGWTLLLQIEQRRIAGQALVQLLVPRKNEAEAVAISHAVRRDPLA